MQNGTTPYPLLPCLLNRCDLKQSRASERADGFVFEHRIGLADLVLARPRLRESGLSATVRMSGVGRVSDGVAASAREKEEALRVAFVCGPT